MLEIFTKLADYLINIMGIDKTTHFGTSVHFFIEDTTKIFFLIYFLIFLISLFRSQLSPERVRQYLSGKSLYYGYLLAIFLGVVTPFCSCSSIPLFMGFIAVGVPFGVAIAFLLASPLISEIAIIMLLSMGKQGLIISLFYIASGTVIAFIGGYLADKFNLESLLSVRPPNTTLTPCAGTIREKAMHLIKYAHDFASHTVKELFVYILIGLVIGAFMHGYVPKEVFITYLGKDNILAVPFAALVGIPIYASHGGVVPIIQVFLMKGVPIGTSLTMLMSITAISLPEMIMLKKVFTAKLLLIFAVFMFIAFIISGYLINLI